MAEKFVKASADDTVVHAARELYRRKFNIGTDWTKMRFCAFLSMTASSGTNVSATTETVGNSTPADRIAFGISKYSAGGLLPGVVGQNFIGMNNHLTNDLRFTATTPNSYLQFVSASINWNGGCTIGTTRNTNSTNIGASAWQMPTAAQMVGTSTWAELFGLEIEILNRGTATQQVKIYMYNGGYPAATGAVTDNDMRAALSAYTPIATAVSTQDFHIGGTPAEIPDAIFIYCPCLNNLIRVHNYGVLRIA